MRAKGESTKGVTRKLSKRVFNRHKHFFELLFRHWVSNAENEEQIEKFFGDLHIMFKKVAEFHGINSKEWEIMKYKRNRQHSCEYIQHGHADNCRLKFW